MDILGERHPVQAECSQWGRRRGWEEGVKEVRQREQVESDGDVWLSIGIVNYKNTHDTTPPHHPYHI